VWRLRSAETGKGVLMAHPLKDVVVVLPGIMGSVLHDSDGHEVWGTSIGSIVKGVLTRGKAAKRLQLPQGIGDESAPDGVVATALMPDIHVIPGVWSVSIGYEHMTNWFRTTFDVVESESAGVVNFVQFPYDWRLSNRNSAAVLQKTVEPILERFRAQPGQADAKLVFVGHSMGGLVARYYVDVLGGHEVTRKVITLGTPHRGALNALVSLVNGISKGIGPLKIDLTEMARSLPGLFQLLPEYACIESPKGLLKTTEVSLADVGSAEVADAMRFHDELRDGAAKHSKSYASHPILARTQPTDTTARLVNGQVQPLRTIEGRDEAGDGTVPRLSACPYGVAESDPIIRYVMDKHGALPSNEPIWVELEGVLTATDVIARAAAEYDLGVACDDVLAAGDALDVSVEVESDLLVDAVVQNDDGSVAAKAIATDIGSDTYEARFEGLAPGRYALKVGIRGANADVTTPIVVVPIDEG
jgi:pimeloyl-ACP methyl ester carboxylesterase